MPQFRPAFLIALVPALFLACEPEKDPKPEPTTCAADGQLSIEPVLLPLSSGQYVLRWESAEEHNFAHCLTLSRDGGEAVEIEIVARVNEVSAEDPFASTDEEYPLTNHLYDARLDVAQAGAYRWALVSAGQTREGNFTVSRGDTAHVALIGDTDTNLKEGDLAITEELLKQVTASGAEALVHAGDIVYNVYVSPWADFFATFGPLRRQMPMLPAIGNHEYEFQGEIDQYSRQYLAADPSAADGGRAMVLDVGPVRFIAADSNGPASAGSNSDDQQSEFTDAQEDAMWQAVEAALADAGDQIKVVIFHHPVYSLSHHLPVLSLRERMLDLDERYDINFVLNGHNHVYERFDVPEKFHTLVSGGGGAGLYTIEDAENTDAESTAHRVQAAEAFHWVDLSFTRTKLTLKAVDLGGETIEQAQLDIR